IPVALVAEGPRIAREFLVRAVARAARRPELFATVDGAERILQIAVGVSARRVVVLLPRGVVVEDDALVVRGRQIQAEAQRLVGVVHGSAAAAEAQRGREQRVVRRAGGLEIRAGGLAVIQAAAHAHRQQAGLDRAAQAEVGGGGIAEIAILLDAAADRDRAAPFP